MSIYKMKKQQLLERISHILDTLDVNLKTMDSSIENPTRLHFKRYLAEKKALLEIKHEVLKKEGEKELILNRISDVIWEADTEIIVAEIEEENNNLSINKSFIHRKALHEIKYLTHRAGIYKNYDKNELDYEL